MPGSEMVRVTLTPGDGDDDGALQIVIDMKVDGDTRQATGPFPAFGRIGDFKRPETLYPFALMFDGRMDLGALATEAQRQARLDIRTARVVPGETVRATDHLYVIRTVTPLLD